MKFQLLALCGIILGTALIVYATPVKTTSKHLVGANECTWGPSYWCYNISNAKNCNAVSHCIQTVWEKHEVPEDTDSICKICLDMVTEARDQLRSNETQEDLRAVFEGSCKLILIKPITKLCIKTVDNFIPELVEALSSEMNPQQVCSVAGLCNNAAIDKMIEESAVYDANKGDVVIHESTGNQKQFTCDQCFSISNIVSQKFHQLDRDDFLNNLLKTCGKLSSFSDSCSNIIINYFNEIYEHLSQNLNSKNLCHLTGACASNYHQHDDDEKKQFAEITAESLELEIRPMSRVGIVNNNEQNVADDIPCELCEQLVKHLRDLLIANTTELEFKSVLEGLCKQTKSFKSECLSIVDQYYGNIYHTLVNNLNANEACMMIEICPRGVFGKLPNNNNNIAPLLPQKTVEQLEKTVLITKNQHQQKKTQLNGDNEEKLTSDEIQEAQLPIIDHLMLAPNKSFLIERGNYCLICQYFLHFVQNAMSTTKNEEDLKKYIKHACYALPKRVETECDAFIDTYGDAVLAMVVQELDPAEICPKLYMCPTPQKDVEILPIQSSKTKSTSTSNNQHNVVVIDDAFVDVHSKSQEGSEKCPLCLFAVQEAINTIKTDKSKSNIKHVLSTLCGHLPKKLQTECNDFIETYGNELINMLANDFSPQQICSELKLCDQKKSTGPVFTKIEDDGQHFMNNGGDILTNEIFDDTVNGQFIDAISLTEFNSSPNCILCEQVIKEVEKKLINKKSRDQIKAALERSCHRMHKLENKCDQLIEKYGDRIVDLLLKELTPKEICRELGQCILQARIDLETSNNAKITVIALQNQEDTFFGDDNDDFEDNHGVADDIADIITNLKPYPLKFNNIKPITSFNDDIFTIVSNEDNNSKDNEQLKVARDPNTAYVHVSDSTTCVICQTVITKLEKQLEDKKTQQEIEDTVKNICHSLPKKYDAECTKFISNYATLIINLVDTMPPKQICSQINLCSPPSIVESKNEVLECAVCHAATMSLVDVLDDPTVEHNVEQVLDKTCSKLPGQYNDRCVKLIKVYGPSMMNIISRKDSKLQTICTEIGSCYPNEYASFAQVQSFMNKN